MVSQVVPPNRAAPVVTPTPRASSSSSTYKQQQHQQQQQQQQVVDLTAIESTFQKGKGKADDSDRAKTMWHVHNRWGLFAWIEFGLKITGCFTAFIALTSVSAGIKISLLRVVELILLGPLVLGLIIPLLSAFAIRESFNFFYIATTFLAHIAIMMVLLFGTTGMNLIVFCTLMAVGEFFRLAFLEATPPRKLPPSFTVGRRRFLVGFVFTYIAIYLVITAMETLTVIDDNKQYINTDIIY